MKLRRLPARPLLAPWFALLAAGCASVPERSVGLASIEDAAVTSTQLQLRAYETGRRLGSAIEATADSVSALSEDDDARRRALLWKTTSIPLVQEASLRSEPLVAVVDLWAFTVQQADFFREGDGRDAFGPLQPVVLAAADAMVEDARRTVGRTVTSGEVPDESVRALHEWAASHPIEGVEMRRESLLASDWSVLGLHDASLFGTVASADRSLQSLSHRLGYINEGLMKQVRWNAELLAEDALSTPEVDSLLSSLVATSTAMGKLLGDAPATLDRIMDDLTTRKRAEMAALDRQRLETLEALERQRIETLAALAEERAAVLAALRSERIATLASIDSIARRTIDHVDAVASRMLLRVLLTIAFLGTVAVVGAVLALRRLKGSVTA